MMRPVDRQLEPTAGRILVDGEDSLNISDAELRCIRTAKIGMVFRDFDLLPHRAVRKNVSLPLEIQHTSLNQCN